MLLYYIGVILSYLLYQAAIGGLFFVLAKTDTNNPLFSSMFLMVEPGMMLLFGIYTAKLIDDLRGNASSYFYTLLSLTTCLSFIGLYFLQLKHAGLSFILLSYSLLTVAFMAERIYRQRLARDFSRSTGINQGKVNAIANLANRGAPILSPFILYLFPDGLDETYLFSFIAISFLATVTFCGLSQKISILHKQNHLGMQEHTPYYQAEKLGVWHIWHLFLMNFMLGGLFMVLSQSVLTSTSMLHFLQGPSLYFTGFWFTMLFLMISPRQTIVTPYNGLYFTAALGVCLMLSSYGGIISIVALAGAGMCFGAAINQLGTFIQNQLDHKRYSYYETRAQMYGRIALLIGLSITGWALHAKFSIDFLRGIMGFGVIITAGLLCFIFMKYVCRSERCLF